MNETNPESQTRDGRPKIKDEPLTPAEAQQRHREKLKANGQKIVQVKIKEPELVEVLGMVRQVNPDLKSDTAAANWIMANALRKLGEKLREQTS